MFRFLTHKNSKDNLKTTFIKKQWNLIQYTINNKPISLSSTLIKKKFKSNNLLQITEQITEPIILEQITAPITESIILEPITEPKILEPITEPKILEPIILEQITEPITEQITESIILEPITAPITEPITESIILEPITESIILEPKILEQITEPITEQITESIILEQITEPITEPITESIILEPITEPITESITNPIHKLILYKQIAPQLRPFIKTKINKITQLYRETYQNNISVTGLGDFIRGSYFLMQFGELYGIPIDILIQHPIKNILPSVKSHIQISNDIGKKVVFIPTLNNWTGYKITKNNVIIEQKNTIYNIMNKFMNYLIKSILIGEYHEMNLYIYTICFPSYLPISSHHCQKMRLLLQPTEEMKYLINTQLNIHNTTIHNYQCIHIRSGDNYHLETKNKKINIITKLKKELYKFIISISTHFSIICIADNNEIKKELIPFFPKIKWHNYRIKHLGEGVQQEYKNMQHTMLDFYIMSYATKIISFTIYPHGSGFSRWCAETYQIPYTCLYIG